MKFLDRLLGNFFKSEGDRKKLVTLVLPSFAIQSSAILIGLIINFIMARGLGAGQYGIFTFSFSVIFPLINFVSFGFGVLMVREMPHLLAHNSPGLLKGLYNWSIKLIIPFCLLLTGLVAGIVCYILPHDVYTKPILIASAVIPFYGLMNYYSASLKGLHKIILSQVADNLIRPITFLLIMVWLFYCSQHFNAISAIAVNVFAFAAGMLYSAIMFHKSLKLEHVTPEYDTKKWWKGLGSLSILNGILSLDSRLDLIMIGVITNASQVGVFSIAHKIAITLYFFLSVMNTIIAPSIARMNSLNDKSGLQKMITKTVRNVMIFSLPTGIIFIVFSKWIMSYFGPEFAGGQMALIILCVAQLFSISCGPAGVVSVMTGHERFNSIATIISMSITVVLNLILTPRIGITGSAIAAGVGIVAWNIYMVSMVKKHVGIYSWIYNFK
jgi:O-antigen/teichoic acid export membrane protein